MGKIIEANGFKMQLPALVDLGPEFGVTIAPFHLRCISEVITYKHDNGLFSVLVKFFKQGDLNNKSAEWMFSSREFITEARAEKLRCEVVQKIEAYVMEERIERWEQQQKRYWISKCFIKIFGWWHCVRTKPTAK